MSMTPPGSWSVEGSTPVAAPLSLTHYTYDALNRLATLFTARSRRDASLAAQRGQEFNSADGNASTKAEDKRAWAIIKQVTPGFFGNGLATEDRRDGKV